jgi:hypothetical protein
LDEVNFVALFDTLGRVGKQLCPHGIGVNKPAARNGLGDD